LIVAVEPKRDRSNETYIYAVQLMTKLASKVDGGDAENKFSGSDQSLDALIAAMEEAQVLSCDLLAFNTYARKR
jgi:hypothetical protein